MPRGPAANLWRALPRRPLPGMGGRLLRGLVSSLWRGLETYTHERRCAFCYTPFTPPASADDVRVEQLCPACAERMRPAAPACPLCGRPLPYAATTPAVPCGACILSPPPWERLEFHGRYEDALRQALVRFKFGGEFSLIPLLGGLLAAAARRLPPCDAVVPIPRHPLRLRDRGFNQVQELARVVAARQNIPLVNDMLTRTRHTQPQTSLPARQRLSNPQGSFTAGHVKGLRLLLLDDVITTGATARHAVMALKDAGAVSVHVAVAAAVSPLPLDKDFPFG